MGKAKKQKKDSADVDLDNELDGEEIVTQPKTKSKGKEIIESDEEDLSKNKKTSKKDKKKKRGDNDSDVEAITKDIEELDVSKKSKGKKEKKPISNDSGDDDTPVQKKAVKSKVSGFAVLEVEDSAESAASDAEKDIEEEKSKISNQKGSKQVLKNDSVEENRTKDTGKKGKKSKKKRNDSDEDIDKVLAELELEYSGGKKIVNEEIESAKPQEDLKTKTKDILPKENLEKDEDNEIEDSSSTVKSAAQKKKDKKEREKQKKITAKKQDSHKKEETDTAAASEIDHKPALSKEEKITTEVTQKDDTKISLEEQNNQKDDKKTKKKKGVVSKQEEKEAKPTKGLGKKTIQAMQDALKKIREEEERLKLEEEQRIQRAEEAETARLEQLQLEQERKDKKKKKEKERKERLKAEGKLLSAKQKADKARAQAMLEALRAQGVEMPDVVEKKPRAGTRVRGNKLKSQNNMKKWNHNLYQKLIKMTQKLKMF